MRTYACMCVYICVGEEDFPDYRDVSCLVEREICKSELETGTKESERVLG